MNVCLKDCFLSVNFFCSSKKTCSEGVTCPCITVAVVDMKILCLPVYSITEFLNQPDTIIPQKE